MKKPIFNGVCVATYTPFSKGEIDYDSADKLLQELINGKADALVILGSTGEPWALSEYERNEYLSFCRNRCKGIPLIAGCGSPSTEKTYDNCAIAKDMGYDGALCVTPYYCRCTQKDLYEHYSYLESLNFPIIPYNVPSRTNCMILPETLERIIALKNVIGFKEADGNPLRINIISEICRKKVAFYSGNDEKNADFYFAGASGCISAAANIVLDKIISQYQLCVKGLYEAERKNYISFEELLRALSEGPNPSPLKYIAKLMGRNGTETRLPLGIP